MDIYKELVDLKKAWSERTLIGKLVLSFAFIVSLISVGSLADTVFTFKGFIVEGINFYREITKPARELISNLIRWDIPILFQDTLILMGLALSGIDRINAEASPREGIAYWIGLAVVLILTFFISGVSAALAGGALGLLTIWPLIPVLYGIACNKYFKPSKYEILVSLYILGVYLLVACIAAISEGLSRPL